MVALPCGSRSINSTRRLVATREAARLMQVVVLPTPPFLVRYREYLSHSCLCSQSCRAAQYQQMALALATRYGQGVFAIEVEVCRQCYQLIGGMNALHCQPTCFGVAQMASPVAEVLHAAERTGNDPVEWQFRLEGFDATVDNLQVIQFEFEFLPGSGSGFFLPLLSRQVTCDSGNRIARGIPGMPPPLPTSSQRPFFDEGHNAQAIEQMP